MQIEKVTQPPITLVGLSVRTSFKGETNPSTSQIGPLAGKYFATNVAETIPHRTNPGVTLAVYTDYESDEYGEYTYFIGEAVEQAADLPEGLQTVSIPGGEFAKLTTEPGVMPQVVIDAWQQIWNMSAEQLQGSRAYQADYEVYDQRAANPDNTVLDIYIGLKGYL